MSSNIATMTDLELVDSLKEILLLPYVNSLSMRGRDIAFKERHAELDKRKFFGARPRRQLFILSDDRIAAALYQVDPMHTGCKKSGRTDEYANVAKLILERTQQDVPLPKALVNELAISFSITKAEVSNVDQVVNVLCEMSPKHSSPE